MGRKDSVLTLDQSTVANMTAALEFVCKRIPADVDSHDIRKAVADTMLASANAGTRSLAQFQEIGLAKLKEVTRQKKARFWQSFAARLVRAWQSADR
jgi:hypothetical protein